MKDYVNYGNFCRYSQSPYVYDYYDNFFQKNENYLNYVNFCSKIDHREPSPMISSLTSTFIIFSTSCMALS